MTRTMLAGFHDATLATQELRRMGLPWSEELVRRTPAPVGGARC